MRHSATTIRCWSRRNRHDRRNQEGLPAAGEAAPSDRNPNNPQAAERFKEINEAHDVLSDVEKRKKYNQLRRYGAFASPAGGSRRGRSAPEDSGDFDISDLGGFGDIFSSIFGRRGAGREAELEETETEVTIPFRTAALGGTVPITLSMPESVRRAAAAAPRKARRSTRARSARVEGQSRSGRAALPSIAHAPSAGERARPSQRCPTCQGSGEVRVEKRVNVEIPPGVEEGRACASRIRDPRAAAI